MTRLRVGFESHNYGAARNCYAPVPGVEYVKLRRAPLEFVPGKESRGFHRIFLPVPPNPKVDLVHLWNRVSVGRTPWGVSFEDSLPYLNTRLHPRMIKHQRKRLLSQKCRFIVGMSDFAVRNLRDSLTTGEWETLEPKVRRVYPEHRQPARTGGYPALLDGDPLRLIFVGGDFFRKGGEALLRTVEQRGDDLKLHLTVVSRVAGNDYRGTPPVDVDVDAIRERLVSNEHIDWKPQVSHADIMELIESHHIGLLPTLSDTFGYSVLEFMSLGVPSIVSNVQALPEFTGPDTGWQLEIDTDDRGIWVGRDPDLRIRRDRYFDALDSVSSQIDRVLTSIRSDPTILVRKSKTSLERFATQFDPVARSVALTRIYAEAIDR